MSVPYYNPVELWAMPPDHFNEWRSKNDLPLLLAFFRERLPAFQKWLDQFGIDEEIFCRTASTGQFFIGAGKKVIVEEPRDNDKFVFYRYWKITKERLEQVAKEKGRPVLKHKEFEPYFYWAKKNLGRKRYFSPDKNNRAVTDTFLFNGWEAPDVKEASRAILMRDFRVLKLGGITLGQNHRVDGRNLDFADLDYLSIKGDYHGSWGAEINFSSCRRMEFKNASLHHFNIRQCNLDEFTCIGSKLQRFGFEKCRSLNSRFINSDIFMVSFIEYGVLPQFDKCDLQEVIFEPDRNFPPYAISNQYRRLRVAYQDAGKRHEASQNYYLERQYERKALFNPYFEPDKQGSFPSAIFHANISNIFDAWWKKDISGLNAIKYALMAFLFHLKIWLNPKYLPKTLYFKLKYFSSLFQEILWGYGEYPSRVLWIAIGAIITYAYVYYVSFLGLKPVFSVDDRFINSIYFSVVTFTTLGYGDILPNTSNLKIVCGSEALVGAFLIGMVIAGFSNKNKY